MGRNRFDETSGIVRSMNSERWGELRYMVRPPRLCISSAPRRTSRADATVVLPARRSSTSPRRPPSRSRTASPSCTTSSRAPTRRRRRRPRRRRSTPRPRAAPCASSSTRRATGGSTCSRSSRRSRRRAVRGASLVLLSRCAVSSLARAVQLVTTGPRAMLTRRPPARRLMLRQPGSEYVHKRSSSLLKVKTFHDAEARVVAHEPGKVRPLSLPSLRRRQKVYGRGLTRKMSCAQGKYVGMLGALECVMEDGETRFSVGSGLTDERRANPPPVCLALSPYSLSLHLPPLTGTCRAPRSPRRHLPASASISTTR